MAEPGGAQASATATEPDAEPAGDAAAQEQLERSLRRRGGVAWLRSPWLAWGVAIVAAAAAVVFAVQAGELRSQDAARSEALQAGEVAALQLTTFSGATIDEWVEQTRTIATGTFAEELAQRYDQQLRADLREFDVESVGEIINSFVQRLEGDEALIFAVLRQTTRYPTFEQTVEDEVRFEITLRRENGAWLVSDAKLLSPTPPLAPRPFLEDPAPEEE